VGLALGMIEGLIEDLEVGFEVGLEVVGVIKDFLDGLREGCEGARRTPMG